MCCESGHHHAAKGADGDAGTEESLEQTRVDHARAEREEEAVMGKDGGPRMQWEMEQWGCVSFLAFAIIYCALRFWLRWI